MEDIYIIKISKLDLNKLKDRGGKMENKIVDFFYFSGTGNTLLVVKKMAETFEKNEITVNLHKIEESNHEDVNLEHTIGIAFPVAVLSTYPFVWNFIKSLPESKGTEIFMVDTLAGFSGGIVGPMREIVKKKGYNPIGACEIIMPPNVFYIQDKETCDKKVQKGLLLAEKYALDLINKKAEWGRVPVLSDVMYLISIGSLKITEIDLHQKWFIFNPNKENCNKCNICIDLCPVENIKTGSDGYPEHDLNCEYCLRCVSFCPRGAMPAKFNYKGKTYRGVKAKEFLK